MRDVHLSNETCTNGKKSERRVCVCVSQSVRCLFVEQETSAECGCALFKNDSQRSGKLLLLLSLMDRGVSTSVCSVCERDSGRERLTNSGSKINPACKLAVELSCSLAAIISGVLSQF